MARSQSTNLKLLSIWIRYTNLKYSSGSLHTVKSFVWLIGLVSVMLFIAGCSGTSTQISGSAVGIDADQGDTEIGTRKGQFAPDFSVETIDGETVKLSELTAAGKPTLVYFWTTWCPNCAADLTIMKDLYPSYKDDFELVAINMDTNENLDKIRTYNERHNFPFTLANAQTSVLRDYNVIYTTTKVAVDSEGRVLWRGSGRMTSQYFVTLFEGLKSS